MATVAEQLRVKLRDHMYVKNAGDIPDDYVVKKQIVCAVGHPGVCKGRDAGLYRRIAEFLQRLHGYVLREPGLLVGSALQFQGFSAEGALAATLKVFVAYIRRRDPIVVAFVPLLDVAFGVVRFKTDSDMLVVEFSSQVAHQLAAWACHRVMVSPLVLEVFGDTVGEMKATAEGTGTDFSDGVVAARPQADLGPAVTQLGKDIEAGFKSLGGSRKKQPKVAKPPAVKVDGAVFPAVKPGKNPADMSGEAPAGGAAEDWLLAALPAGRGEGEESDGESSEYDRELDAVGAEEAAAAVGAVAAAEPAASGAVSIAALAGAGPGSALAGSAPRGPGYDRFTVVSETGQTLGYLVYNRKAGSLDAHCCNPLHCAEGACHMNRTLAPSDRRASQGRPLGHLVAWLLSQDLSNERSDHFALRVGKGALADRVSYERRLAARQYIQANPAFETWRLHEGWAERPRASGEGEEPLGRP